MVNSFMADFHATGANINIVDSKCAAVYAGEGASISAQRLQAESITVENSDIHLEQCSPCTVTRRGRGASELPESVTQVLEWHAGDGNYENIVAGRLRVGKSHAAESHH